QHGEQFKAERAERRLPFEPEAITDYLASGVLHGIGPATAAAIVERFGARALDIIAQEPEKLAQIKGITAKRAAEIGREFNEREGVRKLIEYLAAYGVSPLYALKLYKCYGEAAERLIRNNPYILADEYFGGDFSLADSLAANMGIESDAPERLEAALLFELRHNRNNGHCFIPEDKLVSVSAMLTGADREGFEESLETLVKTGEIVREEIAGVRACYLKSMYLAETNTARRLSMMAKGKDRLFTNTRDICSEIEKLQGITYTPEQREAVQAAAESNILVLTGGPGTGKTTTVRAVIALFERAGLKIALAAPTGRAAKRMSELCGRETQTVHKLLGAGYSESGGETVFKKNEKDMLDAEAVILDESSMADILLLNALLLAMRPSCRLVLTGDADQLPPVGPGSPFADIIRSGAVRIVRLTEIFRQAQSSEIVKNAHKINSGVMPELKNGGDFFFLRRRSAAAVADTVTELVSERLPKNMGIDPWQILALAPFRKGEAGTVNLNRRLQQALNPPSREKNERNCGAFVIREGDRVMQIRNNYDIIWQKDRELGAGIFNGDIGRVEQINNIAETVTVDFEGRRAVYTADMIKDLELAYAMTVHKAQGSEYSAVIFVAAPGPQKLMTRSILYTAITRARQLLIITGSEEVVAEMTANDRRQKRYCGLKTRMETGRY
ncbi:MAG: ATP-dependent RecD-like DNA helicase, partial [Oscillospiraceae bacterium]|nr:ATP-dependent RecD-like DNA helicase [Oscillospiraceae bacterium]